MTMKKLVALREQFFTVFNGRTAQEKLPLLGSQSLVV